MSVNISFSIRTVFMVALGLVISPVLWATNFVDVQDIAAPTGASELIYSPNLHRLVVKNSSSAVMVIKLDSLAVRRHLANYNFTDMSVSPSGRYVFVADYGGENIGYGTPANQSYVHRLDLKSGQWNVEKAYIAGNIQATSNDTLVLKSLDQWVTFTNNQWSAGDTLTTLNTSSSYWAPGYYAGVYSGNFRYDPKNNRLIHGNSGSSSQEIQAFRIVNNEFIQQEGTGTYGSAQGYGGSYALSTDSSAFYYGRLCVDALDVSHTLRVFPEAIYAATGDVAFGNGKYYDAHTGALLGNLGFNATVYGLNPAGSDFWVYDQSANMLRHFVDMP